jgi:dihydroorotase
VRDGLIDTLSSMHTPQDEESKRLPFEEAASGAVGLETLLPAALRLYHAGDLTCRNCSARMALNPAKRLGLDSGRLSAGAPADLVLFDPDVPFVLDRSSCGRNPRTRPLTAQRMQGRVLATYVAGRAVYEA